MSQEQMTKDTETLTDAVVNAGQFSFDLKAENGGEGEKTESIDSVETPTRSEDEVLAQPPTTTTEAKSFKILDREFKTPEEMAEHIRTIEMERIAEQAYRQGQQDLMPVDPMNMPKPKPKIEELIFENPTEGIRALKEDIRQEIDSESRRKAAWEKTWQDFYSTNTDLAGLEDVVETVLQRSWGEVANLPTQKSLPLIADRARQMVNKIREGNRPKTTLQAAPALMSSPGMTKPQVSRPAETKVLDFVHELKNHQRRGRKS